MVAGEAGAVVVGEAAVTAVEHEEFTVRMEHERAGIGVLVRLPLHPCLAVLCGEVEPVRILRP